MEYQTIKILDYGGFYIISTVWLNQLLGIINPKGIFTRLSDVDITQEGRIEIEKFKKELIDKKL
jgi:hypothetical protein